MSTSEAISKESIFKAVPASTVKRPPVMVNPGQEQDTGSTWIRTRLCACPHDVVDTCARHSPQEKGWEVCPTIKAQGGSTDNARWLWARRINSKLSFDDGQEFDAQAIREVK